MNRLLFFISIILFSVLFSCNSPNPNINDKGTDELKSLELNHEINDSIMSYQDVVYVPIYSDIYTDAQNQKSLLAATLSIRNTSYKDSLFIGKIDYFNTDGALVRSYIKNPISLPPMASINYVIEREDETGGHGANFIVMLSAKNKTIKPLIQAIMIGQSGNKSFAFSTDGYSIIDK